MSASAAFLHRHVTNLSRIVWDTALGLNGLNAVSQGIVRRGDRNRERNDRCCRLNFPRTIPTFTGATNIVRPPPTALG
jgi:hypothetical protein